MEFLDISQNKDYDFSETQYRGIMAGEYADGAEVVLKGCVQTIRDKGEMAFIVLRTARFTPQFMWEKGVADFAVADIKEGDCVEMTGTVKKSEYSRIGYDIIAKSVKVLSRAAELLPFVMSKKQLNVNFDYALDMRPVSMRHPKERAYIKLVEGILRGFREWLTANRFTEVLVPKIVAAGAEGGADMFNLDYFGKSAYLSQSPQMYKQMMVGVYERVFCIGNVYRAEKSHTNRHLTEFNGIDIEMGYINSFYDIMETESRALRYTFNLINRDYKEELEMIGMHELPDFDKIPHIRFADAKRLVKEKYGREYRSEDDLEPEEEKLIGEIFLKEYGSELVFVTHYPSKKRPFYAMDDPADPRYTLSFDLLLNGAEITTGGQRIHDYNEQIAKMQARGMTTEGFEHYLMIHKYGMPPHGGLGIGVERLAMKLLEVDNIRKVTLFPRDTERLEP